MIANEEADVVIEVDIVLRKQEQRSRIVSRDCRSLVPIGAAQRGSGVQPRGGSDADKALIGYWNDAILGQRHPPKKDAGLGIDNLLGSIGET
jgi:hypothetical protein